MTNKRGCSRNRSLWPRTLRLVIAVLFLSVLSCICVECKRGKITVSVGPTPKPIRWQIVRASGFVEPDLYPTADEARVAAENSSNEGAILQELANGQPTGNAQHVEPWDPRTEGLPYNYLPTEPYWEVVNEFGRSTFGTFEEADLKARESWGSADLREWKRGKPVSDDIYHLRAETPPLGMENIPATQPYYELDGNFYLAVEEAQKAAGLVGQYVEGKKIKEMVRGQVKKTIKRSIGERIGAGTIFLILLALFLIGLVMHFRIEARKLKAVEVGIREEDKTVIRRMREAFTNLPRWFFIGAAFLLLLRIGTYLVDNPLHLFGFMGGVHVYILVLLAFILAALAAREVLRKRN